LGKRIRNPACDHDNNVNHHHYYDHHNHNNGRSDYNNGHANNCAKYYVPNNDSTDFSCPWLTSTPVVLADFLMN
jgi:hypothetical protein